MTFPGNNCGDRGRTSLGNAGMSATVQTHRPRITSSAWKDAMEKLDRIDFRILAYLQEHGRVTNIGLADAVGLSASPCLFRVKRLERIGYIKSYGARIALEKLGD